MRKEPGKGTTHATSYFPMRCYSTCEPGGYGLFLPVFFDKTDDADPATPYPQFGSAGDTIKVYDPFYMNCVLGGAVGEGEFAWVTRDQYRGIYVLAGSQGLTRKATLDGALAPGSSVAGSIKGYKTDGSSLLNSFAATIYHWGNGSDETWNTNIVAHYSPSEHRWYAATDQT